MKYLYSVFIKYDADHSGELDNDEMYKILNELGVNISRRVCGKMLKDMDTDQTGTVDMEEFVQFFDRVQSFQDMKAIVTQKNSMSKIKEQVMGVYMLVIILFFFGVCLNYVQSSERTKEMLVTVIMAFSLLLGSFLYIVIFPLLQLTLRAWVRPPLSADLDPRNQRKPGRTNSSPDDQTQVVELAVVERDEEAETAPAAGPKAATWRRRLIEQESLGDASTWGTAALPGMVEASPPRPPTAGTPVAPPALSPGFTRTRNTGDSTHVQDMEEEVPSAYGDDGPYKPYNYDHLNFPDIVVLRPSFNPWSSTRARIY
jgi:hypothetical protein